MDRTWLDTRKRESGLSLPELLVVLVVLASLTMVAVGAMNRIIDQSSAQSLVGNFKALVSRASIHAVMERRHAGLVFESGSQGASARLYEDGDGDGVMHEDIEAGVDRPLASRVYLREGRAFVGIPPGATTDPMGRPLSGEDPVRFGRGDILSFSPEARATPGTLYLREGEGLEGWAFRVAGIDGRVRVYRWFKGKWERWE